ncbi:hypothetical protein SCLARK_001292 [Spiroplasma clarkii]|uniref:restriction endonuclease n=1 Tax=Spiroplasma clarkii TaxID=2139 RepID=UPI000B57050D|nr:restriction endonuclease [Spiroplasma clarkii]ARU91832.1 hypothetical protein SCLARK_001292 [Spiroplasma clarkii]
MCSIVADCIVKFLEDEGNKSISSIFSSKDIWFSEYAKGNVEEIFKKANVTSKSSKNEYDKFFQQPMKLFAYAKILNETKIGQRNLFNVLDLRLLKYIAIAPKYALHFLQIYIEKVLKDSDLLAIFNNFFNFPNEVNFNETKNTFYYFTKEYTNIGSKTSSNNTISKPGYVECGRIFTKIINPLAFKNDSVGTKNGKLSRKKITYDMLMYNRDNFRDIYSEKPKDMSRKDYENSIELSPNKKYYKYSSSKAKQFIRDFNAEYRDGMTELLEHDEQHIQALHMHHIFPESKFPEIADYLENIIAITPNQHYVRIHPMNKTNEVDSFYQYLCLISKADRIKENLENNSIETIYDFQKFMYVISFALNDDDYLEINKYDYEAVKAKLKMSYGIKCN